MNESISSEAHPLYGQPVARFVTGYTIEAAAVPPNIIITNSSRAPLVTIRPDGELEYGPDYTPDEAARAFWDALRHLAPASQFYEGEEPYTTEGAVPTPAQWIWKWNRATPARRLQVAEAAIRAQAAEQNCIFGDHAADIEDLRAARLALHNLRELHRPVEFGGQTICAECSAYGDGSTDNAPIAHPCATVQALGGGEAP